MGGPDLISFSFDGPAKGLPCELKDSLPERGCEDVDLNRRGVEAESRVADIGR